MLKIRAEQMRAFERAFEEGFIDRLIDHLKAHHGDAEVMLPKGAFLLAQLPPARLRELVWNGVERARAYGLTWESTITAFVAIMFEVAPNFDRMPVARAVSAADIMPPDARIRYLLATASGEDWEQAMRDYDPAEWTHRGQGL